MQIFEVTLNIVLLGKSVQIMRHSLTSSQLYIKWIWKCVNPIIYVR